MAKSYLGGHSLHRHTWFGRTNQRIELPLEESGAYFEIGVSARGSYKRNHTFLAAEQKRREPRNASRSVKDTAETSFLLDFAKVKIELAELISAADPEFGARIARLKAVLKRTERQINPAALRAITEVEKHVGGLGRATIEDFVRFVSARLNSMRATPITNRKS